MEALKKTYSHTQETDTSGAIVFELRKSTAAKGSLAPENEHLLQLVLAPDGWAFLKTTYIPTHTEVLWIKARLEQNKAGRAFGKLVLACLPQLAARPEDMLNLCKYFSAFEAIYTCPELLHCRTLLSTTGSLAAKAQEESIPINISLLRGEVSTAHFENIPMHALSEDIIMGLSEDLVQNSAGEKELSEPEQGWVRALTYTELKAINQAQSQEIQELKRFNVLEHGVLENTRFKPIIDSFLTSSERGVVVMDKDGLVVFSNANAADVFQTRYGHALRSGDNLFAFLPAEQAERLRMRLRKSELGERFVVSDSYRNETGKVFVDYEYAPVFAQGQFWGVVLRLKDVTLSRLREQERLVRERQIRSLTEKIPGVIFQGRASTTEKKAVFVYVSPSSVNYLGQLPDEILSKPSFLFEHSLDQTGWQRIEEQACRGEDLNYEGPFLLPNLGERWLLFTAQVSFQTSTNYVYDGLIMDVTDRRLAQQQAIERQERLDKLTQSAPGVVFELMVHGSGLSLSYISQGGVELLALPQDEVGGYSHYLNELFSRPENQPAYHALQNAGVLESAWESEFLVRTSDGQRWLTVNALPEHHANGYTTWYGMMVEVTHLKENEQRLSAYAEALQQAQLLARMGNFEYVLGEPSYFRHSDTLLQILGLKEHTDATLLSHFNLFSTFVVPEEVSRVAASMADSIANLGAFDLEYRIQNHKGHEYYLQVKARVELSADGSRRIIKGSCQDVTDRKMLEATLVKAREEAEAAAAAKTQFLSAMSHEIRTPLNAVIGINGLLLREVTDPSIVRRLNTLEFCARNLLNTINKLLDFSKLEAGKYKVVDKRFKLLPLLTQLKDVFSVQAKQKGIELVLEHEANLPDEVVGDENGLHNVLNNLLSNALKFTSTGMICLAVELKGQDEDRYQLAFNVMDTGQGIPADKQEMIFNIYEQVDASADTQKGGTGLGLPIVRQLLESMGTTIKLRSEVNRGSTFSFVLSLGNPHSVAGTEELEVEEGEAGSTKATKEEMLAVLKGSRILVAEDNEINAMIVREFLHRWGMETTWAQNGDEVVRYATEANHDMILMDIQMPVLDGIRATRIIRNMSGQWFKQVPILAFSAFALQETANLAHEAGMNDYLLKPFTPDQLMEKAYLYLLPFQKRKDGVQDDAGWHLKPDEMAHVGVTMKIGGQDYKIISQSLKDMQLALDEALIAADPVLMQRLCHKYIPSLKMLNVQDVWLDITIARQVVDAGNLSPELRQYYLDKVQEKCQAYLDSISETTAA